MLERIKSNFTESIQTKIAASELLAGPIEHALCMLHENQCTPQGHSQDLAV